MGTSAKVCRVDLAPMIWAYAPNAENGAVTVKVMENQDATDECAFCGDGPRFVVSYHPKPETEKLVDAVSDKLKEQLKKRPIV